MKVSTQNNTARTALLIALTLVVAMVLSPLASAEVVHVSGRIDTASWTANNTYVLSGAVFVDGRLNIEAGTRIVGESATNGTLVIARGAQIFAEGRQDAPIVMTSDQPVGQRFRADWGGLILNGSAPINDPGGVAFGEGDTGEYGGDNPEDNSGVLRFVRVEYAGTEFSPDNELNGIAFQGVGRGTTAEFLQVHFNKDDCVEFFGGTVDVKYVVCTGAADDNFDWTNGWTGRAQFLIAQQHGDDADQGIEADNNAENNDLEPRSHPTIYNVTLIGDPDFDEGDESDIGMLLREGTGATIKNGIVTGFKESGLDIDGASTYGIAQAGGIVLESMIFWRNNPNFSETLDEGAPFTPAQFIQTQRDIVVADPGLRTPFDLVTPDFRPGPDANATNGSVPFAVPPNDGFFDVARFIGAMGQERDFNFDTPYLGNWVQGWTNFEPN